jgi:AcrR family transcriptional regulator
MGEAGTAVVVGGGIGGVSAAVALAKVGWRVTVLERDPVAEEVGAGITLFPNAMRALDALDLGDPVRAVGRVPDQTGGMRDPAGRWLVRVTGQEPIENMVALHRADLHATSMNDVIAEAGLSAGAVYRYFRSKEELIGAVAEEALGFLSSVFDDLLADGAAPSPADVVEEVVRRVLRFAKRDDYDLTRVALQVWAEALRNPAIAATATKIYAEIRGQLTEVARRRQQAGFLPAGADPTEMGQVLFSLVPGFVLQHLLLGDVDPAGYGRGLHALFGDDGKAYLS